MAERDRFASGDGGGPSGAAPRGSIAVQPQPGGIVTPAAGDSTPGASSTAPSGLSPSHHRSNKHIPIRMTPDDAARMIQAMQRRKQANRRVEAICEIEDLIFLRYANLKEAFQQFDRSKDKKISLDEWSTRIRKLGFLGSEEVVKAVFEFMDDDQSGFVTPKEFKQLQVHRSFRNAIKGTNIALRLILMRHPEADYSEGAYANGDEERQLTPCGTAQAVRMAKLLQDVGWVPPENRMFCLCSTARRCRQTVDFMQPYMNPFKTFFVPDLYYPFTDPQEPSSFIPPAMDELFSEQVLRAILPCQSRVSTVFIVGHNPLIEWFMSCRAHNGRKTPLVRMEPGDCALLQLAVEEDLSEEDYLNRKNRRPWLKGIFSSSWDIVHHLEADPRDPAQEPKDTLGERVPAVGEWYDMATDFAWNSTCGPPLVYTKKELTYLNTRTGYEVLCGKGIGMMYSAAINPPPAEDAMIPENPGEQRDEAGGGGQQRPARKKKTEVNRAKFESGGSGGNAAAGVSSTNMKTPAQQRGSKDVKAPRKK